MKLCFKRSPLSWTPGLLHLLDRVAACAASRLALLWSPPQSAPAGHGPFVCKGKWKYYLHYSVQQVKDVLNVQVAYRDDYFKFAPTMFRQLVWRLHDLPGRILEARVELKHDLQWHPRCS